MNIFLIIAIVTSFIITLIILIYQNNIWLKIKRIPKDILEYERSKKNPFIQYPKKLETDNQINLYIKKNRERLPKSKRWDFILIELIREMSSVGWNTEIPIYSYETFGEYNIKVITKDNELREKLEEIISKYLEKYETM